MIYLVPLTDLVVLLMDLYFAHQIGEVEVEQLSHLMERLEGLEVDVFILLPNPLCFMDKYRVMVSLAVLQETEMAYTKKVAHLSVQQQAVVQVEVYGLNSQEAIGMALVSLQLMVGEEAAMEQYTGVAAVVAVEELLSA